MPNIADIRKQYPQYNDLSDQQLADSLHQKFYSDMPKDEFSRKIGLPTELKKGETVTGTAPVKMGAGEKFVTGLEDAVVGGKQLAAHIGARVGMTKPEDVAKIDTAAKMREQQITEAGGRGLPGAAGQIAAAVPIGMAGTAIGGPLIGGGLAAGTLMGALQPATGQGSFTNQKAEQMIWGGALGAGTVMGLKFLGTLMGPSLDAARQWLVKQGVQLTPGQAFQSIAREAEEAFKSYPVLRSFIAGAEGRGITGFNSAIYNQTLEGLQGIPGVQTRVPAGVTSREAFVFTKNQFDKAYDVTLQGRQVKPDFDFGQDISDIRFEAEQRLSPKQFQSFIKDLTNELTPMFNGKSNVKDVARKLQDMVDRYRRGGTDEQYIADYFQDAKASLTRAVARQNPGKADQLRKVDLQYAMFARARDAASRRARSGGEFTPSDLLQTISSQAKRGGAAGRNRLIAGDELLQKYAEYGQQVLPPKLPDSGTGSRLLWALAIQHPMQAGLAALASAPYTRAGSAAFDAYLAATRGTAPIGQAIKAAAPAVAPGAASVVRRKVQEEPEYGGPQQ